jgi:hypothetical protein
LTGFERTDLTQSTELKITGGSSTIRTELLTTDSSSSINMQDGAADDELVIMADTGNSGDYSGSGTLLVDAGDTWQLVGGL